MVDLTDCDREPIHIPGTIQPYGVLLVLAEPALTVAQVSENVGDHFPLGVEDILGQPLSRVIDPASVDEVREALREERWYETNPLRIKAHGKRFDGIVHRHDGAAILELEPNPEPAEPTPVHHPFRPALMRIQRVSTLAELADVVVQQMRRVTGFERVMFYRFHEDGHGSVDAEAKEPALEPYLGLHYPASDIPAQARQLYLKNWLRLIFDARATPARIVPTLRPDTGGTTRPQLFGAAQRLAHSPRVHGKHGGPRLDEHLAHRSRPPVGTHQLPEPHRSAARFARDAGGVRVSRSPDLAADRRARGPRTARAARLASSDRGCAGRCDARERRGGERTRGPARPPEGADGARGRRGGRVGERRGTCDVRPHAAACAHPGDRRLGRGERSIQTVLHRRR